MSSGSDRATSDNQCDGFTLLEMLVVLAIIGMLTLISFPYFNLRRQADTADVALDVLRLAQFTRLVAIKQKLPKSLQFDLEHRSISSDATGKQISLPSTVDLNVLTGRELVTADRTANITFMSDGSSTGGEVLVSAANAPATKVQINWLTGIPTIVTASDD